tara:strand:+ start:906 stop:1814 length:909 start_codon:yes stop_codon:yes gene_type:complete
MKVLIYGVGGIGGYLGSLLLKTNYEITFLSRHDKYESLKKKGIVLRSDVHNLKFEKINVKDSLSNGEAYDFVILAVKLYDFESALEEIRNKLNKDIIILPFQNGVYSEEKILKFFGKLNTYGAVAQISCFLNPNFEVVHIGKLATFFVGGYVTNDINDKLKNFVQDARKIGLDLRLTDNISAKLWEKFIFLSAYSGITTLTSKTIGEIFDDSKLEKMFIKAMTETYEVSKRFKIKFKNDPVEVWKTKIKNMPYQMTSSMYLDFTNKKKLELNWLSGFVVSYARENKLKCYTHEKILDGILSK